MIFDLRLVTYHTQRHVHMTIIHPRVLILLFNFVKVSVSVQIF